MKKIEKREAKKQDRGIVDFMMVTNHFFHKLGDWISEMEDPRNPSYITYSQADLNYMAILKNICGQHSMCNAALYSRRKKHFIFDSINIITALSFR